MKDKIENLYKKKFDELKSLVILYLTKKMSANVFIEKLYEQEEDIEVQTKKWLKQNGKRKLRKDG